jgi:hypothetical protein
MIMRLVLVHGINNENNSAAEVEAIWMSAMRAAWQREGLAPLENLNITTTYYAKELAELSTRARDAVAAGASQTVSQVEFDLLQEYATESGITQQEIVAAAEAEAVDVSAVEAGLPHEAWLIATSRALENILPTRGRYLARVFLRQAAIYIERKGVQNRIKKIVRDRMFEDGSPIVVVAHSLGTVIAYELLKEQTASRTEVPLFCTLGSPLAVRIVANYVGRGLNFPKPPIRKWINGAQREDFVTLGRTLQQTTVGFDGIENVDTNSDNPDKHDIVAYLSDQSISRAVHAALAAQ